MSYEKNTWETGDTITAQKLNHIEDGIAGGVLIVEEIYDEETDKLSLGSTWQEIYDANFAVAKVTSEIGHAFHAITGIVEQNGAYYVGVVVDGNETMFHADSADDYPVEAGSQ